MDHDEGLRTAGDQQKKPPHLVSAYRPNMLHSLLCETLDGLRYWLHGFCWLCWAVLGVSDETPAGQGHS